MTAKNRKAIKLDYFKKAIIMLAELGYSSGYITKKALDQIKDAIGE
jgi:hypothetical protein